MVLEVKEGDTLSGILHAADIEKKDAMQALAALGKLYNPASLKVGQKVKLEFDIHTNKGTELKLNSISVKISKSDEVKVVRYNGKFLARKVTYPTVTKLAKASRTINKTLFSAMNAAGIPVSIRERFLHNYSYDVDFQRDIRKGDKFEVLFERIYTEEGEVVGSGDIIYSSLTVRNRKLEMYYYTTPDGSTEYYNENGDSIIKSLLRTPIDGARITSGYGQRRHPILGYSKTHKGVDFGASKGTPIYAAGDGVVIERVRKGSYGNYIKIYHNDDYSTAYAHLNGFARRVTKGSKVKQGQVIGYVGSTGRSTGPHLHYEVLKNGRHVNPLSVETFSGRRLMGIELAIFNKYKKDVGDFVTRLGKKT